MLTEEGRRPHLSDGGLRELYREVDGFYPPCFGVIHLDDHLPGRDVGVPLDLVEIVDRGNGKPHVHHVFHQLIPGLPGDDLVEGLLGHLLHPQLLPQPVLGLGPVAGDLHPAPVLGLPEPPRHVGPGIFLPDLVGFEPRDHVTRDAGVVGEHAVQLGDVDHLAHTGPVPVPDGREDGHGGHGAGPQVPVGLSHLYGGPLGVDYVPCEAGVAAHGLGDGGVSGAAGVGAVLAEAREGGVDYLGVGLLEDVVPEAEALHGARGEVLHHDVGDLDEVLEDLDAPGVLEVQGDVLLVHVQVVEDGAGPTVEGTPGHAPDGPPGGLDLDHLGPEVREHHGTPGAEPDVAQVCDPYVVQDFCHNSSWIHIYS